MCAAHIGEETLCERNQKQAQREPQKKRKDIELKTGKKIYITAISAKNIKKKRKFKINKKIFFKNPLNILKNNKIDILFECIGMSDGISKKLVETALKNKIVILSVIDNLIKGGAGQAVQNINNYYGFDIKKGLI